MTGLKITQARRNLSQHAMAVGSVFICKVAVRNTSLVQNVSRLDKSVLNDLCSLARADLAKYIMVVLVQSCLIFSTNTEQM